MNFIMKAFSVVALSAMSVCSANAATKITYIYTDPQGTPLAEADTSGNITATFDYRPYGAQAMGSEPNGPGYTGHVNDPDSGLIYMQARYYDPLLARFLSVDPVAPVGGKIFSTNRFSYVENNPIMNIDPDGREPCDHCDDVSGPGGFVGRQMRTAGVVRAEYVSEAAKLDPSDKLGRSELKEQVRAKTPSMLQKIIEAARPSVAPVAGTGGRANASNPTVNKIGSGLKVAGNSLLVASAAVSAYDVATSPEPTRALAGAGGAMLGGIGGGEGGAWVGAGAGLLIGGPPGAAVGAIVGGLGGSAVGAHYGSEGVKKIYDISRQ